MSDSSQTQLEAEIAKTQTQLTAVSQAVGSIVIGQEHLRKRLLTALLTGGHILLEGVPGLAKTLSIQALASSVSATFSRIQFTPDLLPADLIGTEIFRAQDTSFEVRKGPVFAHFVLADEINRAPAKVQSALLETMQEKQVTIGKETFSLPQPFLVLATQNPIEQEGTYPLPEAQVDRFLVKVKVGYPSKAEERQMLDLVTSPDFAPEKLTPVIELKAIEDAREVLNKIYVDEKIRGYISDLVWASREPETYGLELESLIELGASPRATISLFLAARAEALLEGQSFVVPQHVKNVAADVMRHRIIPSYEAEAQNLDTDNIVEQILAGVPVP